MDKILKNTTITDISLIELGFTIPASGQITLDSTEFLLLSGSDVIAEITTDINSGDIVINDGTTDLSAAEALRFLAYPDRTEIQHNGTVIVRYATKIDMIGNVNVTDKTGGKVEVDVGAIFGSHYAYAESEGVSTTTNGTYQQKLRLTTATVPAGNYIIHWTSETAHDEGSSQTEVKCELDDSIIINETRISADDSDLDDKYLSKGGFREVTLTNAVHTIDIDYRELDTGTSAIRRARISMWRTS